MHRKTNAPMVSHHGTLLAHWARIIEPTMPNTRRIHTVVLVHLVASVMACDADEIMGESGSELPGGPATIHAPVDGAGAPADLCGQLPVLLGTDGPDKLVAGPGGACLIGLRGQDQLVGGAGSDVLLGGKGFDVLTAGPQHDTLVGGLGQDQLFGGKGNDLYLFYPADDQPFIIDTVTDSAGQDVVQCVDGLKPVASEEQDGDVLLKLPKGGVIRLIDGMRFTLLGCGIELPGAGSSPDNGFKAIGKSDQQVQEALAARWQAFRQTYMIGDVVNWQQHNTSVEAMSRTLMIAYALDRMQEFSNILGWMTQHMYVDAALHPGHPYAGYMSWAVNIDDPSKPCNTPECAYANGNKADLGPATDGEVWYTTALLLAGKRWNRPDWTARAKANLAHYVAPREGSYTPLFDANSFLPVFAPNKFSKAPGAPLFSSFTDPAYIVPPFFALWATYPDVAYPWANAASSGRAYFATAIHPTTGLVAENSDFAGHPVDGSPSQMGLTHGSDSIQTALNLVIDRQRGNADPAIPAHAAKITAFFADHPLQTRYYPDGTPAGVANAAAQACMLGVWASALPPSDTQRKWLKVLWNEHGGDWYSAQYCLLGKAVVSGLIKP